MENLDCEIWRVIVGYEGFYEVSNAGNVRSVDRFVVESPSGKERLLKSQKIREYIKKTNGYCYVTLRNHGKINFKVHQLVGLAFLVSPGKEYEVDHKSTIKSNNALSNLHFVTHKQNCNNPISRVNFSKAQILNSSQRGKFGSLKSCAKSIVGVHPDGRIVRYAAIIESKSGGFSPKNISECLGGRRPHHFGFVFSYAS